MITVQEYKTAKGISKNDKDDQLEVIVAAVSDLIEGYIGYPLTTEEVVEEIVSPFSTNIIHLSRYPVNEIVSVEEAPMVLGFGLDSTITYISIAEGSGYRFNKVTGGLIKNYREWSDLVRVTYTTGYADGDIPKDLKLAAIALVDYYFKEQYIQSKNIMGTSVSYSISKDIPPHIKIILDYHKQ